MEEIFPFLQELRWDEKWLPEFLAWTQQNIFSWDIVWQLAALLAIWQIARLFGRRTGKWAERRLEKRPNRLSLRMHASYREIAFLCYAVLLLWGTSLVAESAGLPYQLLWTVTSLLFAWSIIRFTSSTIESPFWARVIASILWTLAALSIMGMLGQAVALLDRAAVTMGDFRFSLLVLLKGIMAFGVLLWVVSLLSRLLGRGLEKSESLTPSQRVLFQKITNIFLIAFAILVGLNIIGLDLTTLAVFSGALGLGIGFGLQKIFSNLISGIILLLDKSVKPGDVIAIGNTYGWVNSLGARCVSVITRDGKEHLIPNENLITQEVENWSYSDHNVRLHIGVRVSYDSDLQQVKQILEEAVAGHPRILSYPKPKVLLIGFGESSVDHEIRAWIGDPQEGISNVTSDIYYRIWEAFKKAGITIPYPQRDIHFNGEDLGKLVSALK